MAFLTGDQASFTYANGAAVVATDGFRWEAEIGRRVARTTPFGYAMERVTLSQRVYARGALSFLVTATTPPLPTAVTGDLTLFTNGTNKYVFKALLTRMSISADSPSAVEQTVRYEFEGAATNTTDTVVPT